MAEAGIYGMATAVPDIKLQQDIAKELAEQYFDTRASMDTVYNSAGIETRYTCVPFDFYFKETGWPERMKLYHDNALDLLEKVAKEATEKAGIGLDEVDGVMTISTTGVAIPSLDARLVDRLNMKRDVMRLPIFGFGCAGGALGLARAAALARGMPGKTILMLVVELCTVNFRYSDRTAANFVSCALFGDGAAGLVIRADDETEPLATVGPTAEWTWEDSLNVMGFSVEDDGFGVIISPDIPRYAYERMGPRVDAFLAANNVCKSDINGYICHPGGRKVIEATQRALKLEPEQMELSRQVLRDYGNMSAPTVLFVFEKTLEEKKQGQHLMAAFGPGFSLGMLLVDLH